MYTAYNLLIFCGIFSIFGYLIDIHYINKSPPSQSHKDISEDERLRAVCVFVARSRYHSWFTFTLLEKHVAYMFQILKGSSELQSLLFIAICNMTPIKQFSSVIQSDSACQMITGPLQRWATHWPNVMRQMSATSQRLISCQFFAR